MAKKLRGLEMIKKLCIQMTRIKKKSKMGKMSISNIFQKNQLEGSKEAFIHQITKHAKRNPDVRYTEETLKDEGWRLHITGNEKFLLERYSNLEKLYGKNSSRIINQAKTMLSALGLELTYYIEDENKRLVETKK